MKLSICIPQYNRYAHLLMALESCRAQTYHDIEVVISDDGSTDATRERLPGYLASSGLNHKFIQQGRNLGYDANLRATMQAASGEYLFILGNDDALPEPTTLTSLAALLAEYRPDLIIGNIMDAQSRAVTKRVSRTRAVTGNPEVAMTMFRALSCVTGLVFSRQAFLRHNTSKYDGSIYVQMFLGSSIIAAGGTLLTTDLVVAETGTDAGLGHANSYVDTLSRFKRKLLPATGGLDEVGRVVCEAVWPYVPVPERARVTRTVFSQLLNFSYAYWLYDYRKHGAPWAALNLALGCFPPRLLRNTDRSLRAAVSISPFYLGATSACLMPLPLLDRIKDVVQRYSVRRR